jgi:hypothetical protein
MCVVSPVDETFAVANAAMHVDIVCEIENIKAYFMTKLPIIEPTSTFLPAK